MSLFSRRDSAERTKSSLNPKDIVVRVLRALEKGKQASHGSQRVVPNVIEIALFPTSDEEAATWQAFITRERVTAHIRDFVVEKDFDLFGPLRIDIEFAAPTPDLPDRDRVMIRLQFEESPPEDSEPPAEEPPQETPPPADSPPRPAAPAIVRSYLRLVHGAAVGAETPLERRVIRFGRDREHCDIVVPHDRKVSRRHAIIARVPRGDEELFVLIDDGSRNHVYLNGEQVFTAVLTPGDQIRLGETVYEFVQTTYRPEDAPSPGAVDATPPTPKEGPNPFTF